MEEDDLIRFDDEDEASGSDQTIDEEYNVFEDEAFDEETIETLIDQVHESLDVIESVVYNMFYAHQKLDDEYKDRINTLEQENEKYCEEIKKLYQELASISTKKE